MEELRNRLLMKGEIDLYKLVCRFITSPKDVTIHELLGRASDSEIPLIQTMFDEVMKLYTADYAQYQTRYKYGQAIVWEETLRAYDIITKQKRIIEQIELSPDLRSYSKAVSEVKRILNPYAKMQVSLSNLEETLGIDRFLDRVGEGTFSVLRGLVSDAKKIIEKKTAPYKLRFQMSFDTTNVSKIIAHSLLRRDDNSQICDMFSSGNKQTILILIDGFGFCQYLWNCGIDSGRENLTFRENLFAWLRDNDLSKECLVGSSFVTDTGAGLAQIYLGKKSSETRIIASKLRERNVSTTVVETKRVTAARFAGLFSESNSITDIVATLLETPTIYYCSRYPDAPSGFSSCIFKSAEVKQVIPSERVFSLLLEDMSEQQRMGLQVLYLTNIDNSGHTMGAYSSFEKQEHQRINYLLRSFLIELAANNADLFDGHRNILITADHGMYESSNIMVPRSEVTEYLNETGISDIWLIENNRALLVYNEGDTDNEYVASCLTEFFWKKNLDVDIQTPKDRGFSECIGSEDDSLVRPDIVVRFVGEGLFYSNKGINRHLLHFGGHGGYSVDETFVPLIEIPLNDKLLSHLQERFLNKK